jgi:ribosomal-protein-alanine N-acetyltransferase
MFPIIKIASQSLTEQYTPELFNFFYENYPNGFIVAEQYHKINGFIIGFPTDTKTARISMLAITEQKRRQHIGTSLLNYFINNMHNQNIHIFELEVNTNNTAAIHFYKKQGFTITDTMKKFYQTGQDAYIMKKND